MTGGECVPFSPEEWCCGDAIEEDMVVVSVGKE